MTTKHETQDAGARAPGVEDMVRAFRSEMAVELRRLEERTIERALEAVKGTVGEIVGTDRSLLEALAPERKPALGGARVRSPYHRLYSRMPEEMRAYRDEDTDHWAAQWIRGLTFRDHAKMRESEAQLEALGWKRATTLEGVVSGTSGMTDGSGASLLPTPIAGVVMVARDKAARLRPLVTVLQSVGKTLRVPTAGVASAAMVAEGATAAQGEPTLTHKLLDKEKAQARFAASIEMLRDSAFNLVSFFAERAGSALGLLEDTQICTSNGTTPNITANIGQGITEVNEAIAGTLAYADVVNLYFAVPEPYRTGAVWLGDSTVMKILSLIDDAGGRPIFQPSTAAPAAVGNVSGNVGSVLGAPVYDVPLASGSLWFGNPRDAYVFLEDGGIEVAASEHVGFTTDTVQWKFTTRFDGNVATADAARKMLGLTTAG